MLLSVFKQESLLCTHKKLIVKQEASATKLVHTVGTQYLYLWQLEMGLCTEHIGILKHLHIYGPILKISLLYYMMYNR